jgi:hypothetical protein
MMQSDAPLAQKSVVVLRLANADLSADLNLTRNSMQAMSITEDINTPSGRCSTKLLKRTGRSAAVKGRCGSICTLGSEHHLFGSSTSDRRRLCDVDRATANGSELRRHAVPLPEGFEMLLRLEEATRKSDLLA